MVSRLTLGDADIAKVLLTIAEHQERLVDPAYSKKLREDILTLPEELQKKMADANALLAKSEILKAEIKKQQDAANEQLAVRERAVKVREATMEALNERKKEAEEDEAKVKVIKEENIKEAARLAAIPETYKKIETGHLKTKAELDKRQTDLDQWQVRLDKREEEIFAYEQQINETAEQVQNVIKSKIRK
jgi:hypothetical protein